MFKIHNKQQLSGSIHSGHFMVSRLDDDDDENNDVGDDTSESERDNAQSVEIDVNNPESVADAAKNLDIAYRLESPSTKNELVTSWNDLDRPAKRLQKQHQYLTYYTNTHSSHYLGTVAGSKGSGARASLGRSAPGGSNVDDSALAVPMDARIGSRVGRSLIAADQYCAANLSTSSTMAAGSSAASMAAATSAAASLATIEASPSSTLAAAQAQAQAAAAAATSVASSSSGAMVRVNTTISSYEKSSKRLCQYELDVGSTQQLMLSHQQQQQQQQLTATAMANGRSTSSAGGSEGGAHHPHAVTIDTSLTKLLECMSLYYSSKLTSPKWKSFKGLKLRMKYKIRLNNLIWRAWFLQCIRGRRPPGCQFTAPAENEVHKKSETIVLEGKYWKRKEKAIADEYKKWRIFHSKQKSQPHYFRPSSFDWESRASSLVTSTMMYEPEYNFYPDYDMNIGYNLDELPPMLEELEQREQQGYYQPAVPMQQQQPQSQPQAQLQPTSSNPQTRMIEPQQQEQQQQQQLQSAQQQNTMTSTHQQLQQQHNMQLHQQQQQQMHLPIQVPGANQLQQQPMQHHQLLLKTERSPIMMDQQRQQGTDQLHSPQQPLNASLSTFTPQMALQQQQPPPPPPLQQQYQVQTAQQQHPVHNSLQTNLHGQPQPQVAIPFGLDQSHLYQQLQQQQRMQQMNSAASAATVAAQQLSPQLSQHHHLQQQHSQQQQQQQQQHQQLQQSDQSMYMCQDLSSLSSSASCSSFGGRTEHRRVTHINAEQKRRCNIKNGFETLRSILPSINQNVNVKVSKASMLQKAAICINQLTSEQKQQLDEQEMLKQQIDGLKQTIRAYQSQLPTSGAAVSDSTGSNQAREWLQTYVRRRALENWKFWIFSLLIEPLFATYYSSVSTNSLEEACKTIYSWLDQNCGLNSLRRDALESMTRLSKSTNVLSTPQTLPTEAFNAVRYTTPNSQSIISSAASSPSILTPSGSGVDTPVGAATTRTNLSANGVVHLHRGPQLIAQNGAIGNLSGGTGVSLAPANHYLPPA